MSPEVHQHAVEIFETKTGLEYSDDVERTREWGDAHAQASEVLLTRTCRVCGCTDAAACLGGCWWASETDDLCSTCAARDAKTGSRR